MKKIILITLMISFSILSLFSQTAVEPVLQNPSLPNSETNPYLITNLDNLFWLHNFTRYMTFENTYFLQTNNIDASATASWSDPQTNPNYFDGWRAIGARLENEPFKGIYDGNNYSITGLHMLRNLIDNYGFFGFLGPGAIVRNLHLEDLNFTFRDNSGALVGYSDQATIENCSVSGTVVGRNSVSLLAGITRNTSIENTHVNGTITGSQGVGGFVGQPLNNTTINNSSSSVHITGQFWIGAMTGRGGARLSNCFVEGSITSTSTFRVGPFNGTSSIWENCYYNYNAFLLNDEPVFGAGAMPEDMYEIWKNNNLEIDINQYLTSENDVYLINDIDDFYLLHVFGQQRNHSYRLMNSLDLSELPENFYIPIFTGNFDGNNKTLSNFTLVNTRNTAVGLIGLTHDSHIHNLNVDNSNVLGSTRAAAFIGSNAGIVNECSVLGHLVADFESGVFAGINVGHISNSYVRGSVALRSSSSTSATGFVGYSTNEGLTENCYSVVEFDIELVEDMQYNGFIDVINLDAIVQNCFWDYEVAGFPIENINEIEGAFWKTSEEMKDIETYTSVGWDFDNVWTIDADINDGYPIFLWQVPSSNNDIVVEANKATDKLYQAYPNPFNPSTNISFYLEKDGFVTLDIFNVKGQKINTLVSDNFSKGKHSLVWDGTDFKGKNIGSGIYFTKLITERTVKTNKLILIK